MEFAHRAIAVVVIFCTLAASAHEVLEPGDGVPVSETFSRVQAVQAARKLLKASPPPSPTTACSTPMPGADLAVTDPTSDKYWNCGWDSYNFVPPYDNNDVKGQGGNCDTFRPGDLVRGFPSTARTFKPYIFSNKFKNPVNADTAADPVTQKPYRVSNPARTDGKWSNSNLLEMKVYDIRAQNINADFGIGCGKVTEAIAYGGVLPGPTIETTIGTEVMVRFTNDITPTSALPAEPPCVSTDVSSTGRKGRPISIHHHGSASMAPYDGWAEDETCQGESKDYIYPANRAGTGWYHDHALDITSNNAYYGLSGYLFVKEDPDRWNLNKITPDAELHLALGDRVFNDKCQLVFDVGTKTNYHVDNLYGDVNVVSGVAFPYHKAAAKSHRIRILSGAVTRPWLLQFAIFDKSGAMTSVGNKMCHVIAGDGGYRRSPVQFPSNGMFMGVAERYELVCDFSKYAGKTIYLLNLKEGGGRTADAPWFCYSHLLMRINILPIDPANPGFVWSPVDPASSTQALWSADTQVDMVFSQPDTVIADAFDTNGSPKCTPGRRFQFGRALLPDPNNPAVLVDQWAINDQTWHTQTIAAGDVGTNAYEIWCLDVGGGWFHPIHVHLVDFYVIWRSGNSPAPLAPYESLVPKDVVAIYPASSVALLVRFGPHRGKYMFHCHNLRHEDGAMMRAFETTKPSLTAFTGDGYASGFTRLDDLEFADDYTTGGRIVYDQYWNPMNESTSAKPTSSWAPLDATYINQRLDNNPYILFYPTNDKLTSDEKCVLCGTANRWRVKTVEAKFCTSDLLASCAATSSPAA